ncbi:MAG: hypothetical protein OER04_19365, partial [Cyclobacteriaceae bacterium]|nr:hypothetical protein [Cyclobacteriaceae bacterium]
LDNGGVPSAQKIISRFQNLQIGEYLPGRPKDPPGVGFKVSDLKENQYMVLTTFSKFPSLKPIKDQEPYKNYWKTTWTFFLREIALHHSRLIVRSQAEYNTWWISIFANLIARPIHFIMQRKQLMNIKIRAEKLTAAANQSKEPGKIREVKANQIRPGKRVELWAGKVILF